MRDTDTPLDVRTDVDGSLVVQPHGAMDDGCAVLFRQVLVHADRPFLAASVGGALAPGACDSIFHSALPVTPARGAEK